MPKAKNQHAGNGMLPASTLEDVGVSKMMSSRVQAIAEVPEEEFEEPKPPADSTEAMSPANHLLKYMWRLR